MARLLIVLAVLAAIGVGLFLATNRRSREQALGNENGTTNAVDIVPDRPIHGATNSSEDSAAAREAVIVVSRAFAERFGSTTSDRPRAHFDAAFSLASPSLQQSFLRLKAHPAQPPPESTSTTSKAHAFSVTSLDEKLGQADVVVSLQRTLREGTKDPATYIQDLNIQLVREAHVWKVNVATWGVRR